MPFIPMRLPSIVAISLCALLFGCGADTPPEASTNPSAPATPGPGIAKHGGSVVRVGPHPVEVVTHASGQVYAYVEADIPVPQDGEMKVEVPVRGGRRPIDLRWSAARHRYEGRVLRETIIPGPVHVTYVIHGLTLVAVIPVCIIAPAIAVSVHVDHHHHGKHKHKWRH